MKKFNNFIKKQAIFNYSANKGQLDTAKIFGCFLRTLMRWYNKFIKGEPLGIYAIKIFNGYKVKKLHLNYIKNILMKDKTITIKKIHS